MDLRRGCSVGLLASLAGHFHPTVLIEAEWHDGTGHLHSGRGDLQWGGHTWSGIGMTVGSHGLNLVDFMAPAEGEGMTADGGTIRVAATLEGILAERGKLIRNKPIRVWFGTVTEAGGTTIEGEPVQLFTGYFDSRDFSFERSGEEYSHDLTLGLGLGPAPRAKASVRHSAEDQQREYPGDTAGRTLINMGKKGFVPIQWPEP